MWRWWNANVTVKNGGVSKVGALERRTSTWNFMEYTECWMNIQLDNLGALVMNADRNLWLQCRDNPTEGLELDFVMKSINQIPNYGQMQQERWEQSEKRMVRKERGSRKKIKVCERWKSRETLRFSKVLWLRQVEKLKIATAVRSHLVRWMIKHAQKPYPLVI